MRPAAVLRGDGDGDVAEVLEGDLVAVRVAAVGIGRVNGDGRAALHRLRLDRRLRHAVRHYSLVVRSAGIELPDVDAAEGEGRETRVDRVRHVVGVDAVVALVGHIHHVAVRPDAPRAVVAGPAQQAELLVADALEFLRFRIFGRGPLGCGQAVGEELFPPVVGDPHGHAVRPDAVGVAVGGVELILAEQLAAPEVVGEERAGAAVQHPHRLSVRPDAARIAVALGQRELALLEALPRGEVVGEEAFPAAVGDPHGLAVGPDAAGRAVGVGERELALAEAFAAGAVVGVDLVVGALAVFGDPERLAVGPQPRGPVVAAVQLLDVTLHVPLEVDLARGGTTASAPAAAGSDDGNGLGSGVVDVGGTAGAGSVDGGHPVVAGRAGGQADVRVGGGGVACIGDEVGPVGVAVGRDLDLVADDGGAAVVAGGGP